MAPGRIARLTKRAEFLRAAEGARLHARDFAVQVAPQGEGPARFGLTVTRKTGGAVERNRIRRRLRAALAVAQDAAAPAHDYVIVARRGALAADFAALTGALAKALTQIHRKAPSGPRAPRRNSGKPSGGTTR